MEEKNKRKGIVYLVIAVVTLLALIAGATYAYFQAITGNGANIDINATSSTVDNLTFNKGTDITIEANQQNFNETSGNKTGTTNVSATLVANNSTNVTEDYHYNIYLEIIENDFEYSSYTDPDEKLEDLVFTKEYDKTLGNNRDYNGLTKGYNPIPELFLTITGPNAFNKEIPNLTKATLNENNDSYDITELREGIYPIAEDVAINVEGGDDEHKKTDTWNITVTFKNLPTDQELNTGKTFNAKVIIQAEKIPMNLMDVCSEGGLLADCIKELHDKSTYGASNLIYHDGKADYEGEENYELEAGDNSYRYTGSYEKVNNYICFGTDCTNNKDNLFRIVGTFGEDGIKVVKADYANKELLGAGTTTPTGDLDEANPKTDGSYTDRVYSVTNSNSSNGEKDAYIHRYYQYKGNLTQVNRYRWQKNGTKETIGDWKTSLLNTIHLNNNYLSTIDPTYQSLINKHTWIWKNDNAIYENIVTAKDVKTAYDNEIGEKSTNQEIASEKIGLLYVSDYLYGALPKNWSKQPYNEKWSWNDNAGKQDKFGNPIVNFNEHEVETDYRSVTDSNWLYMGLWEWLITQSHDNSVIAFLVNAAGNIGDSFVGSGLFVVRPTFYITNDTKIKGGTGTIDAPYTLDLDTSSI